MKKIVTVVKWSEGKLGIKYDYTKTTTQTI